MANINRRRFLKGASIGAAAVGAIAAVPRLGRTQDTAYRNTEAQFAGARSTHSTSEPVMAYVRDRSKGEVVLFAGTREVVRHDPALAARLLQALG